MKSITISQKVLNHQLLLNVPDEFNNKKVIIVITTDETSSPGFVSEPTAQYLLTLKPSERKKYLKEAAEELKEKYNPENRSDFQSGVFTKY